MTASIVYDHNTLNQKGSFLKNKILSWGRNNFSNYPWRYSKNDWHILVAEIMLQRTRAEQVVPVYELFCKEYPTPHDYLQKGDFGVFDCLGLKWRKKSLFLLASALRENSNVPLEKELLLSLPGIGQYIAAAYRSLYKFKRDVIIDSNIVRLYGSFFGFTTNSETRRSKQLFILADFLTPKLCFRDYNYGLIDFTRAVCKARHSCFSCVLKSKCSYSHH